MSERITKLYYQAAEGNLESKEELIVSLHPLIISSISKYYKGDEEFLDLLQEGRMMVLECVENFNRDLNVPFLGYVKSKLKFMYLSSSGYSKVVSLNDSVGEDEEELINLIPSTMDIESQFLKDEGKMVLNGCIERLPKRQREIILDFYFNYLSVVEISKKYNLTYRTILNTKSSALSNLRKEMEKTYD